jgi:prephenate dehydrogenase
MTNTIIGANGDMGKNLLIGFLKKLGPVVKVDKNSSPRQWEKGWKSEVIWLSVPRGEIPKILKTAKLKPSQLVVDICSLKKGLSKVIAKTGAVHLSLHPLQGPFVPLKFQKWVVIKPKKNPRIKQILKFLTSQKIRLVDSVSEQEHDFMMGLSLGMSELLTVIVEMLLDTQKVPGSNGRKLTINKMFDWSTPAFSLMLGFYAHVINSTPVWLRKELALDSGDHFLSSFRKILTTFARLPNNKLKAIIEHQSQKVKKQLNLSQQLEISKLVNEAFVDFNTIV